METFAPLFETSLRPGVTPALLASGAFCLTLLLAYASYTDMFRGHVIFNMTSLGVICVSWALVPLVFENPLPHVLWGLIPVLFSFVMVMMGAQGAGDFKLYLGLCPLVGPAGIVLFFLSTVVTLIYSIPIAVRSYKKNKGKKVKKGHRLGVAPAGPGIATALPLTMILMGAPVLYGLGMLAAGVLMVTVFKLYPSMRAEPEPSVMPQSYLDEL